MWRYRGVHWNLVAFGLAWVVVMTAFAYEIVTRAEQLNRIVRSRTDALEETNRNLSTLLEQLNAFHQISYEMNQKLELTETMRAFVSQLCKALPLVDGAWLWLDRAFLRPEGPKSATRMETHGPLVLAAQAGYSFDLPPALRTATPDNPLVARCFQSQAASLTRNLRSKGASWGWKWLAEGSMESFGAFPLRLGSSMLGILGVFSRRPLSADLVNQFNLSVSQLAIGLEKARLLREMRRRADELAAANTQLRQLDAMKDWFVSSVSHELRTPLTNIRSFSEILERYEDLDPQERQEFARIIREESERLSQMIDDVLDLARISQGELSLQPDCVELAPLVEKCCKLFSQEAQDRHICFTCSVLPDLPRVYADLNAVVRVLNNLVGNAFKFTGDGGQIEVLAQPPTGGARHLTVLVRDSGVGIAPEDQPRVFERFTQVGHYVKDKPRGTGIGLAICREILAKSGGSIWVQSSPGKGSTFGFTLPLEPTVPASAPMAAAPSPAV
jgi:signal transduction histidine kinase